MRHICVMWLRQERISLLQLLNCQIRKKRLFKKVSLGNFYLYIYYIYIVFPYVNILLNYFTLLRDHPNTIFFFIPLNLRQDYFKPLCFKIMR